MTRREQLLLVAVSGALLLGAVSLYWHRSHAPGGELTLTSEAAAAVELPAGATSVDTVPSVASAPTPVTPLDQDVAPEAEPETVAVSAAGAVRKPGLYTLDSMARVQDLLSKAGGATDEADLSDINLAAQLIDGSTLTIPAQSRVLQQNGTLVARGAQPASALNPAPYTISGWNPAVRASQTGSSTAQAAPTPSAASEGGLINLNTATQDQLETLPGIGPKLAAEIINYRRQSPFQTVEDLDGVPGFGSKRLESLRSLVTAP